MFKFKVTVVERRTNYMTKIFEADSPEEARHLAYKDDSWTDLDGWVDDGERAGESGVEEIEWLEGL